MKSCLRTEGQEWAEKVPRLARMRRSDVRKPPQYSAASTRVLCGKYDSTFRKVSVRLLRWECMAWRRCPKHKGVSGIPSVGMMSLPPFSLYFNLRFDENYNYLCTAEHLWSQQIYERQGIDGTKEDLFRVAGNGKTDCRSGHAGRAICFFVADPSSGVG